MKDIFEDIATVGTNFEQQLRIKLDQDSRDINQNFNQNQPQSNVSQMIPMNVSFIEWIINGIFWVQKCSFKNIPRWFQFSDCFGSYFSSWWTQRTVTNLYLTLSLSPDVSKNSQTRTEQTRLCPGSFLIMSLPFCPCFPLYFGLKITFDLSLFWSSSFGELIIWLNWRSVEVYCANVRGFWLVSQIWDFVFKTMCI